MDLSEAVLGEHAVYQMAKRGIPAAEVRHVLAEPDEVLPVRPGRVVASKIEKYRSRP